MFIQGAANLVVVSVVVVLLIGSHKGVFALGETI
jgi:hypothetical protein